jgi:hypothetical protein
MATPEPIAAGQYYRNKRTGWLVRLVYAVIAGDIFWHDQYGHGLCSSYNLHRWGQLVDKPPEAVDIASAFQKTLGTTPEAAIDAMKPGTFIHNMLLEHITHLRNSNPHSANSAINRA